MHGIAALEADDHLAFEGLVHEDLVDLVLGERARTDPLGHVDDLGVLAGQFQQGRVGQLVQDDAIGDLEQLGPAQRDQVRPPRPGAHEIDHRFRTPFRLMVGEAHPTAVALTLLLLQIAQDLPAAGVEQLLGHSLTHLHRLRTKTRRPACGSC